MTAHSATWRRRIRTGLVGSGRGRIAIIALDIFERLIIIVMRWPEGRTGGSQMTQRHRYGDGVLAILGIAAVAGFSLTVWALIAAFVL